MATYTKDGKKILKPVDYTGQGGYSGSYTPVVTTPKPKRQIGNNQYGITNATPQATGSGDRTGSPYGYTTPGNPNPVSPPPSGGEDLNSILAGNNKWQQEQQAQGGETLDQILASNAATNKANGNTQDNSAVVAGKTYTNQTVGAMSDGLPQATVATPKNPVISRTTNKTDVGYSPTDYSDIDSYDLKGLNDYTRSLQYDQMNGVKLTKEQYLKMQRAIERAQELQSPAKTPNPLEPIIQQQQDTQAQLKGELEQQNQQDYQAQSDAENAWVQQELAYNQQQENTQKNTLGYILGAQGAGTSSYAVDKINEIGQNFARQNQTLRAESFARLQKYKAEQAGATRAELAKYDQNILQLQMKGAEFTVDNAQKLNEFNQEQAKSTEERLNNILQLAQAQMSEGTPLTDQEKAQAKQYGQLLIDAKGGINEALLKLIPPHLMNEALAQGAVTRGAIPPEAPNTINSSNGAYYRDGKDYKLIEGTKPVEKAEKPDYGRYEFKDGKVYDKLTGQEIPNGGGQTRLGETVIDTGIPNVYGSTVKLAPTVANMVKSAISNLQAQGINLKIADSYRSNATQATAYASGKEGVAPPGESFHELGQAFDLSQIGADKMNDPRVFQALKEAGLQQLPGEWRHWSFGEMGGDKPNLTPEKKTAIQDVLTAITDLEASDGKEGAVGISIQKAIPGWLKPGETQFVPGTKAANFAAKFNSLRDLITLPNLDKLKGAMSDKDIAFLKSAATSLSLDMSEAEFDKTLKAVKDKYETMLGAKPSEAQPSNNNDPLGIR